MKDLSRRNFLKTCLIAGAGFSMPRIIFSGTDDASIIRPGIGTKSSTLSSLEARYYEKLENKKVKCKLCPRECTVADLERGYCGVRENRDGVYYTLVYGRPCTYHVDPIEKKPLFHFLPGTGAFSLAAAGCNIHCKFCQNWEISQVRPEQIDNIELPPEKVVKAAENYNCRSIAFTYTEPVVFTEYVLDTAESAGDSEVKTVVISNGYYQKEPLKDLASCLDAVKIDLKAFTEKFYKEYCDGELKPVLEALELLASKEIWFEIVTLLLPGLNDSEEEIKKLSKWIKKNLGSHVPLHFSRFHPTYQMKNLPPTPAKSITRAREAARAEGLDFVYVGNLPGHDYESTYCPKCDKLLIKRFGYYVNKVNLKDGKCPECDTKIPGVWS